MPHPPLYPWGQDDDRTRSIDVVHIEPSIREGVHLVSAFMGGKHLLLCIGSRLCHPTMLGFVVML